MRTSWRRLEDVFRLRLQKKSSRRLQDVLMKTNIFLLIYVFGRRLQDVFKTSWSRRIYLSCPYFFKTSCKNVFKTSSRRFAKTSSKHLANMSWRHLQDVLKTYHQVKLFLLTSHWEVFNTFVRHTAKAVVYRRIHLGHTFWEIYGKCRKFARVIKISQVLVFHFTTSLSGYL